jgi:hypothetical protein
MRRIGLNELARWTAFIALAILAGYLWARFAIRLDADGYFTTKTRSGAILTKTGADVTFRIIAMFFFNLTILTGTYHVLIKRPLAIIYVLSIGLFLLFGLCGPLLARLLL